ncbi:MAG: hypothetical protein HGA85_07615 [Nanoarchaeota archaeon]|nr:hypothetical protein [Nanoarchaeota archaeon]
MDDVKKEMESLKAKLVPTSVEIIKYVRYLKNVLKYDDESIYVDVPKWKREEIEKALKEVERENSKPKPKRYYVSLKEPLDDGI